MVRVGTVLTRIKGELRKDEAEATKEFRETEETMLLN